MNKILKEYAYMINYIKQDQIRIWEHNQCEWGVWYGRSCIGREVNMLSYIRLGLDNWQRALLGSKKTGRW